jgi:hypothetical protein
VKSEAAARRIFLGAVALLVANDWVLKGAGLLPGWLTGKLSDLAGMLVAPVVLGVLLAFARVPPAALRLVAAAAVGLAFATLKLNATLASSYDAACNAVTAALGLPLHARTVLDATDLAALALLPAGAALAGRLAPDPALRRSGALVLGLLACAATSPAPVRYPPYWDLAEGDLQRMWGARVDSGAIVVQLGRHSSDGAFELAIELAAREGDLTLDPRDVSLELPGERSIAEVPGGGARAVLRAAPGQNARIFLVLRPMRPTWPSSTAGTLEIGLGDGGRRRALRVGLVFEERTVGWADMQPWH